jgi:hypothetical protein
MPWARRIGLVRWLAAARNTSGATEYEYSSQKCVTGGLDDAAAMLGNLRVA